MENLEQLAMIKTSVNRFELVEHNLDFGIIVKDMYR